MESSEDDAGTATNASRRESAREKAVEVAEDVNATSSSRQGPSEAPRSCGTPAMSEDNFDGDSVPSPSAQDVNTSTEAILDMIDEIVDGPGAPKRLPLALEPAETPSEPIATTSDHSDFIQESTKSACDSIPPSSPLASLVGDITLPTVSESQEEDPSTIRDPPSDIQNDIETMPGSSSLPMDVEPAVSSIAEVCKPSIVETEPSTPCPPSNIPSSSEEQNVLNISNISECETPDRTVKFVTSSDNRDNVTVGSAESTSSDSSVSDGIPVLTEPQVRSPPRRRLIRPAPCDRKPDSTVSSTVDSQTVNIPDTELSSCEHIAKDVTSSSDAVPTIHGNVKPEEIRNVSEINFCKAETSVSPPKKIKLIRNKVISGTLNKDVMPAKIPTHTENDQCQSTSSDSHAVNSEPTKSESENIISTPQSKDLNEMLNIVSNCVSEESSIMNPEESTVSSAQKSQSSIEQHHSPEPTTGTKESLPEVLVNSSDLSIVSESSVSVDLQASSIINNEIQSEEEKLSIDNSNIEKPSSPLQNLDVQVQEKTNCVEEQKTEAIERQASPKPIIATSTSSSINCEGVSSNEEPHTDQKKVPPIKLNLAISNLSESKLEIDTSSINKQVNDESDCAKQVPKLTIKLKQSDEAKSPVPKLTIKPIRPPSEQDLEDKERTQQVPSVTKINIKPIPKPTEIVNERVTRSQKESNEDTKSKANEQLPSITKLNIKPILKPPEKINDTHRKSSSSEISESECSENDESTSTSDQASVSDQGPTDVIPKVTIKLGKPGTESEGKFYTEQNTPKLTIKGISQHDPDDQEPKLKVVISQSEDKQAEKVPKLTIKTVTKSEGQPLSPKLTIKPLKPPDMASKDNEIPKLKITNESFCSTSESKDSPVVPKITIKPVTRSDAETRTPKKSSITCASPDQIPIVTKLNIKPILKPLDSEESSEGFDNKVPVVSKLNIKPVIKPKDNDLDSSIDDVPKITKLNIKPLKNPEEQSSEEKDCDGMKADIDNSIPVVTKLNIKPIVKPKEEEENAKDSENQSSETGNSSDENTDHIPVVTKLNIKPIVKPDDFEETSKSATASLEVIPVITKLNIKPLVKPGESSPSSPKKEKSISPSSPKKERSGHHSPNIPVVTKLNIKPVVRPEETELSKDVEDKTVKNPPLVMKINIKSVSENLNNENVNSEHACNNIEGLLTIATKVGKVSNEIEHRSELTDSRNSRDIKSETKHLNDIEQPITEKSKHNCVPESLQKKDEYEDRMSETKKSGLNKSAVNQKPENAPKSDILLSSISAENKLQRNVLMNETHDEQSSIKIADKTEPIQTPSKNKYSSVQNCTLLKKLLENTREPTEKTPEVSQVVNCSESPLTTCKNLVNSDHMVELDNSHTDGVNAGSNFNVTKEKENSSSTLDPVNDLRQTDTGKRKTIQELCEKGNENITKPLEISISDKVTNQTSGQDSPRIILKINKTDHGSSAKIITEETMRPDTQQNLTENTQDNVINDKSSPKKHVVNSKKKQMADPNLTLSTGKRLRSSRIVEVAEKASMVKRNSGKRPSTAESSPPHSKESDVTLLQSKRLKLGQLLSSNKSMNIAPVTVTSPPSPTKANVDLKQNAKPANHTLLNNENCSKNGNSKLHNILSNLHAKQLQVTLNNCAEKTQVVSDLECNTSISSSDAVDISIANSLPELQEMLINENSDFRDSGAPEEISQDPLGVDHINSVEDIPVNIIPKQVELTPQPKKRGRPRKIPLSEGAKPAAAPAVPVALPVTALEERPQRSLRLMRDRPAILQKPRGGRGRGRGGRRGGGASPGVSEPQPESLASEPESSSPLTAGDTQLSDPLPEIDPTSSRIKLPRMTEALDNMPTSSCSTPLTSRRRQSSSGDTPELKGMLESPLCKVEDMTKTPDMCSPVRGRGGRGSRGGRGRTPRARGRGRGGGRGAMYMKETMGIYGRVCGPATTTVQLFEEETCMMDDNATPAKPSHLLDEDSQSSVMSSTNDSSKMKKSKFEDLFDSNKVWTAADVKEYTWPPPEKADGESKLMMIQEQVAMFLNVKSFKRRYPELKRRAVCGDERDYVLSKRIVTEALCDLGITAVECSAVLDIMLSDYPHKYEEYRAHQHKQLMESDEPEPEVQPEEKVTRVEMKVEKPPPEAKPEVPKIDPEKTRQDMAAAAIASASEWNARTNALRRGACVDLQSLTVQRPRPVSTGPVPVHLRPPAGFYPHALLPGQYQHTYRVYTPEQLRYFPLNTVLTEPPAPAATEWSSDSEGEWGCRSSFSDDSDVPTSHPTHSAKRKKLTKTKRSSQVEMSGASREESKAEEPAELCRVCKLRLEANRRYTHERFLVCANCNAKLHPSCLELSADTIRKCREYAWQCAECKTCCSCRQPADDDKMLFCDLCDRGFHIYCVGLTNVPSGRWHCVECAVCKSCGARSAWGLAGAAGAGAAGAGGSEPATWHHHTKRGPGGHKVYSHSLCTPCARAYRIGRYCPLCDRSFIGPKGTMQLVICKLCDRQLHQECVRQSGAAPSVLHYTCAECRRGGITSRAAAVRLAPRTIATLFMAKRRFNKYAHRQYLASRQPPPPDSDHSDADAV